MDFITWATSPWGQTVPIHIAWYLIWFMAIAGLLFMIVHALYVGIFAAKKTFAKNDSPAVVAAVPERVPDTPWLHAPFIGSWPSPCSRC